MREGQAIHEYCTNWCMNGDEELVKNCKDEECHLFIYRTGRKKRNAVPTGTEIRDFCLECSGHDKKSKAYCKEIDIFTNERCPLWEHRKG